MHSGDDKSSDSPFAAWFRARGEDVTARIATMRRQVEAYAKQRGVPFPEYLDLAQDALQILSEMWADSDARKAYGDVPERAMYGIAKNLVKRYFERRRTHLPLEMVGEQVKWALPMRSKSERLRCMTRHFDRLNAVERRTLKTYYSKSGSRGERTERPDFSSGAMRVRILRIKRKLLAKISRCTKACTRLQQAV